MSQLPKTKEFLLTSLLLFSLAFNFAVMVFKKLQFRRGSRQNTLNELLVGNFLNLLTLTKIVLFVCVSLVYSVFHAVAGWSNASEDGTRYMMTITVLLSSPSPNPSPPRPNSIPKTKAIPKPKAWGLQ